MVLAKTEGCVSLIGAAGTACRGLCISRSAPSRLLMVPFWYRPFLLFLLRLCTCNLDLTLSHVLIQFLHMRDTQAHYGFGVNAKSICSSHFVQIYPEMVLHACLYHAFKRGRSWLVGLSKMRDTDG